MPPLICFLSVNFAFGFFLGIVVGFSFLQANADVGLFLRDPVAASLLLWGFGASAGMGAIGTGLALLKQE
jgi:hypothetical protein